MGGGFHPIKVVSLRLVATKQNFKEFVAAIWYLDAMLTGVWMRMIKVPKNAFFILSNLLNVVLKKPTKATFEEYVVDTFYSFSQAKKQIILDLTCLNDGNDEMNSLIMSALKDREAS